MHGYDHLVIGSTPLAGLLAALLATEHGRRVAVVMDPGSPFSLRRGFDLSIDMLTRPETLILLRHAADETARYLAQLGKALTDKVEPLFIAETPASIAALAHFRHLAQALGHTAEPLADRSIAPGAAICRVRGASLIDRARLAPALATFLERHDVRRLDRLDTALTLRKDGTCQVASAGRAVEAASTILADDAAITGHLGPDSWDRSLVAAPALALLAEPPRPVPQPLQVYPDRGVTLCRDIGGSIAAVVEGDPATAPDRLAASAPRALPLRRAGEVQFTRLLTADGAPYVGPGRGHKAQLIAGLGRSGAFLAPAIARHIAGKSSPDEAAWFAARGATRGKQRLEVAEYLPVPA